jgi:hypothetical protein
VYIVNCKCLHSTIPASSIRISIRTGMRFDVAGKISITNSALWCLSLWSKACHPVSVGKALRMMLVLCPLQQLCAMCFLSSKLLSHTDAFSMTAVLKFQSSLPLLATIQHTYILRSPKRISLSCYVTILINGLYDL